MGETNKNLWAPWRLEYVKSLSGESSDGCFLCRYAETPEKDRDNLVIWRTDRCFALFNRFPYANGHLLIAPLAHRPELHDLDEPTLHELICLTRDAQRLVRAATGCHGSNVGMNFGKCAGAGLPGHLHMHVVPRWEGDINFMSVLSDTRVIPQSFEALREAMAEAIGQLGLPPLRG
ncbi:MAG TPA: HIT domain-containing protein [Phycisphaerae bacterium]|nr:HIT domain-containing protein [Phycisphaerae bacterium]HOJ75548.1 HIT domain-containing protein [Phycisphaerae bacterium]HOM52815.1 HIT domain-containing protein [Phycisphaerae bacterium]HOQ85677.1 HIT domain-containing protein [Phycisphaerae bacterium]HPP27931.1 HIT domain-containing protein [Phycisphaerae bacterium]